MSDDLLARQDALQAEARRFVQEHRLEDVLSTLGRVVPLGSAVTGLMVWRDLDYCVELARTDVWEPLLPLLRRCDRVDYLDEPERHSVVLRLDGWKSTSPSSSSACRRASRRTRPASTTTRASCSSA